MSNPKFKLGGLDGELDQYAREMLRRALGVSEEEKPLSQRFFIKDGWDLEVCAMDGPVSIRVCHDQKSKFELRLRPSGFWTTENLDQDTPERFWVAMLFCQERDVNFLPDSLLPEERHCAHRTAGTIAFASAAVSPMLLPGDIHVRRTMTLANGPALFLVIGPDSGFYVCGRTEEGRVIHSDPSKHYSDVNLLPEAEHIESILASLGEDVT